MRKAARRIVEKLRLHGHEAFFAGGSVRDLLLRRRPKDIDIATSASPEKVLQLFPKAAAIGIRFGVIQVRMYGHAYEVATFRSDGTYLDGRHPSSVTFSGPLQDARRRDFTVNGLFYDPVAERVIDYVHGRADLQHRIIRTIGDPAERFAEDKLRLLRAIRLACDLDFQIAPNTWDSVRKLAADILQVSWERIRDEIIRLLTGPAPDRGLDLLRESGLLSHILPEVEAMCGIPQPMEFHPEGNVFLHTQRAVAMLRKPSAVLALGTLLHDVGKPSTYSVEDRIRFNRHDELGARIAEVICRRLKMSNENIEQVVDLVSNHLCFLNVRNMRESTLRKFLSKPNFSDHLELHRVDCLSSHRDLEAYRFCRQKLEEYKHKSLEILPLINGQDLIDLGYHPGPIFKEILQTIEDLQLEGDIQTREQALEQVKHAFPLPGKN